MKKNIVFNISLIIAFMFGVVGCQLSDKKSISPSEFESAAQDFGFEVQDYTEVLQEEYGLSLDSCLVAIGTSVDSDGSEISFAIEYYRFNDGTAENYYNGTVENLEYRIENARESTYSNYSWSNYSHSTYTTDSSQAAITRIGNTVMYYDIFNTDITEPKEFMQSIGYY